MNWKIKITAEEKKRDHNELLVLVEGKLRNQANRDLELNRITLVLVDSDGFDRHSESKSFTFPARIAVEKGKEHSFRMDFYCPKKRLTRLASFNARLSYQ